MKELCQILLKLTGSPAQPEHREARSVGNVQRRRAATGKAEKILGFKAEIGLEAGLGALIEWRQAMKSASPAAGGERA